jgi:hypothetical protein
MGKSGAEFPLHIELNTLRRNLTLSKGVTAQTAIEK